MNLADLLAIWVANMRAVFMVKMQCCMGLQGHIQRQSSSILRLQQLSKRFSILKIFLQSVMNGPALLRVF